MNTITSAPLLEQQHTIDHQTEAFLALIASVVDDLHEKFDFVTGITLAKENIKNFNNETIHRMKQLGIIS